MSSNIVSAPINAGGDSIVGNDNTIINNFIIGLDMLVQEYKEQLTNISKLLDEFKPKTALNLLQDLENRISDKNIVEKELLTSKILYLKGLCKADIQDIQNDESSKDFVKAYNTNKNDTSFRNRACIEYLNLGEIKKASLLADEIIKEDEFNIAGWFVKCVVTDDLVSTLQDVPENLKNNPNFINSLVLRVTRTSGINSFEDLKKYNIEFMFNIGEFTEVTFDNKLKWIINIQLLLDKFFTEFPLRYISGDAFVVSNNPNIENAIKILDIYVSTLQNTELSDIVLPYKFYLYYFKYLINNEDSDAKELLEIYSFLQDAFWSYTLCMCQVLNHKKEFKQALKVLDDYKSKSSEVLEEYYVFKTVILGMIEEFEEIESLFYQYLETKSIINEETAVNIFYTFFNIQKRYADKNLYLRQNQALLKKQFISLELKEFVQVTVQINFLEEKGDDLKKILDNLRDYNGFTNRTKCILVRNFAEIGVRTEAISYLATFVNKNIISEELRLYIQLLIHQLYDKDDSERRYEELLELLTFWRSNSDYVDEQLLLVEHGLYTDINDLEKLEIVDDKLYNSFPENLQYLLFLLYTLERKKDFKRIIQISNSITENFNNEGVGLNVSIILIRNQINLDKAFNILYNLGLNPNNTNARKTYFANSHLFSDYLIKFEVVALGNWVVYKVDDITKTIQIFKNEGIQANFIGKKVGDKFIETSKMSGINKNIEILEIFNDALKLFRDILEEAHNPVNELGFESIEIPKDVEDIKEFFIKQFGVQGTQQKEFIDNLLNDYHNYKVGFLEIGKAVFDSDFIDTYNHLTLSAGQSFTTLPSTLTNSNFVEDYGLDFSTVQLFYFLEIELEFKYRHKFKIPYYVEQLVENKILELKLSPVSEMSLSITMEGISNQFYPEDYNEKRMSFLQNLLKWIKENCILDKVVEKLELYPKLRESDFDSDFSKLLVDLMFLSGRENFRLISSDSSIFLFKENSQLINNMLNPEKYLRYYFPEKCDELFYRHLLKWNYVGLDISVSVLKSEFYDMLAGKENFYIRALENMQYSISGNENIINVCSKFLKEIYLVSSLTKENKNRYALELFKNCFYQMPIITISKFQNVLRSEFKLLGNYYDEVFIQFNQTKKLYGII